MTSPPYWCLRDYGTATWDGGDLACVHNARNGDLRFTHPISDKQRSNAGSAGSAGSACHQCGARRIDAQLGLEPTPEEYVAALAGVFREVHRVLRDDGTCWLNLGDSYCTTPRGNGLKHKDLVGIPWRVAFALQADGWYLRQWMPWIKRNPMPENVQDRPTSACEVIFLLTKAGTYLYDYDAVAKKMAPSSLPRLAHMKAVRRSDKQRGHSRKHAGFNARWDAMEKAQQRETRAFRNSDLFLGSLTAPHGIIGSDDEILAFDVATKPYTEAHFATFPTDLVTPCILAGSRPGDTVLDPFAGSGTTGVVAKELGRCAIGIELNPAYAALAVKRLRQEVLPL